MQFPDSYPERAFRFSEETRIRNQAKFLLNMFSNDVSLDTYEFAGAEKKKETLIVRGAQGFLTQIDKISVAHASGNPSIEHRFTDLSLDEHNLKSASSDRQMTPILLQASRLAIFSWKSMPEIFQETLVPSWRKRLKLVTETRVAHSSEIEQFYARIDDPVEVLDLDQQEEFLDIDEKASAAALNAAHGIRTNSLKTIKKWASS